MTSPTRTHRCVDCKLSIVKCQCDHIDLCLKTDMLLGFLKYDGEYSNDRDSKKHRLEFFKYFKPKPKIVFKKKKQIVKWNDDFVRKNYCYFCGVKNNGDWIKSIEDSVCIDCSKKYEYDENIDGYIKKNMIVGLSSLSKTT